ncbi:major facilitator superfamily domain-containing protein [Chytriomyces sp. MP71]|nr:major facilitator superfamily domain-containing protein [Chytriomyces sp. MP71]
MLAILTASLDSTIVATALKKVIEEFEHQDLAPWVGSAYLLTAAPFGVLYGKFADIFGRKWVTVMALGVFELGSAICGAASSMEMLIAGRAIAGIGGGGIFSLIVIIISDIVSIKDRGKYQGLIGAVFGLASVLGPLVGGAFTDNLSWRWCFYINLPLGVVTLATIVAFFNMPTPEGGLREKLAKIDVLGAFILLLAVVALVTPLQLGGSIWDWGSAQTIGCFVLSLVLFVVFAWVEVKFAREPILPPVMFTHASVLPILLLTLSLGASFISGSYFIALFFQIVFGQTATQAGLSSTPQVFGLVLTSVATGILVSKFGRYRIFFIVGPFILAAGTVLVALMDGNTSVAARLGFLFIYGIGCGSMIQMRTIAIQAAVPQELIAVATSVAGTAMTLGGGIGIAITGTLFNNMIVSNSANDKELNSVIASLSAKGYNVSASETLGLLGILDGLAQQHPNDNQTAIIAAATQQLIGAFNQSFKTAYLCLLPYPVLILFLAFFIKEVQFKPKKADDAPVAAH